MTAVLPNYPKSGTNLFGSLLYDHYQWIYSRGLVLRAVVSLFIWWNIIAFPRQSLPHAWLSGLVLCVGDGLAWLACRQRPQSIVLWAMITTGLDLILGMVALTEFSTTIESNAPALLPLIGIELIAYWGWVGYWIGLGYIAIIITTLWPFPAQHLDAYFVSHIIFWVSVNFLIMSSVAIFLHRSPPSPERTPGLTAREQEVYELLKAGLTQKDIAIKLHIERSTVKTHVQHIHRKMGLDDPTDEG